MSYIPLANMCLTFRDSRHHKTYSTTVHTRRYRFSAKTCVDAILKKLPGRPYYSEEFKCVVARAQAQSDDCRWDCRKLYARETLRLFNILHTMLGNFL